MERPGPPNKKIPLVRKKNLQKKLSKKKYPYISTKAKFLKKGKEFFTFVLKKNFLDFYIHLNNIYSSKKYDYIYPKQKSLHVFV